MRTIHTGISLFATEPARLAALPLFAEGRIDAIEWTVDLGWGTPIPEWTAALLDEYAAAGRLYGHGVTLSPTTARFDDVSTRWLDRLAGETRARRYRHVTEHWGFSRAGGLARGAPFPLVASEATIACTVHAMRALAAAAAVPVGLENLALAFSDADVDAQPAMLARVLDAIDGVQLLDLHNVWCQAINYGRDIRALVARYPLARVRQLHVAGGGWSESAYGPPFRRDTHDALVPAEVLDLVGWIIPRCPALEVVILERLPHTLDDEPSRDAWRAEWSTLAGVVERGAREPMIAVPAADPVTFDDGPAAADLARFQDALARALLAGGAAADVHARLLAHPDAQPFAGAVAQWQPRALEVAIALARKWGVADGT